MQTIMPRSITKEDRARNESWARPPIFVKDSIIEQLEKHGHEPSQWPREFPNGMALVTKPAGYKASLEVFKKNKKKARAKSEVGYVKLF